MNGAEIRVLPAGSIVQAMVRRTFGGEYNCDASTGEIIYASPCFTEGLVWLTSGLCTMPSMA